MDENNMTVPYIMCESIQARNERTIKRLIIALVIAIVATFASNAIWLYAWMQYDYTMEVQQVDLDSGDGGVNNFVGRDMSGDINNGKNEGNDETSNTEEEDFEQLETEN